jgi:hypothetical protein
VQEDAEDPSAQAPQRHARPGGLGAIGEGTAYAPGALANHRDVSPATAPIIQIGDSPGSRIHASLGMQIESSLLSSLSSGSPGFLRRRLRWRHGRRERCGHT